MEQINCIGLVLNTNKEESFSIATRVKEWFEARDRKILVEEKAGQQMNLVQTQLASFAEMKEKVDLVVLFGGDGTFLYTARYFMGSEIPLLGVNLGKLGFLTEIEIDELDTTLNRLLEDDFHLEKRMLLKAEIEKEGEICHQSLALNDVIIKRGSKVRLIDVNVTINNQRVNSYRADGLIAATPTGSTAYSLSAGGPVVNPRLEAIIVTPICAQNPCIRPLVVSPREQIEVEITGDCRDMSIIIDGNNTQNLEKDDRLILGAADKSITLLKFPDKSFYHTLYEKMNTGMV